MSEQAQHNVTLSEGTVQKVATGEPVRMIKRTSKGKPRVWEVNSRKVPHAALTAALALAGGDISRLRMQEDGSILVVNASRKKG